MKNKILMLILFAMSVVNMNAGIIWSGPATEEMADKLEKEDALKRDQAARYDIPVENLTEDEERIILSLSAKDKAMLGEMNRERRIALNEQTNSLVRSTSLDSLKDYEYTSLCNVIESVNKEQTEKFKGFISSVVGSHERVSLPPSCSTRRCEPTKQESIDRLFNKNIKGMKEVSASILKNMATNDQFEQANNEILDEINQINTSFDLLLKTTKCKSQKRSQTIQYYPSDFAAINLYQEKINLKNISKKQ